MEVWIWIVLFSAVLFAAKDILAKKYLKQDVRPNQIIFEEFLLMFLILVLMFSHKIDYMIFFEYWHYFLFKAFSIGAATLFYFKLLKRYQISIVSPILNLSPLVLLFLSVIFLSEVISTTQFIGILFILVSTYFLEITVHHHRYKNPQIIHFKLLKNIDNYFVIVSILLLVTISFAAIGDKFIFNLGVNVYTNMFFTAIIILLILIGFYFKENKLLDVIENIKNEPETILISVFAVISNFLVLVAIAIPEALVSLIIPIRRTSTLFSSIFGGVLFHEKHLFKKAIATLGMVVGVVLIVL